MLQVGRLSEPSEESIHGSDECDTGKTELMFMRFTPMQTKIYVSFNLLIFFFTLVSNNKLNLNY